MKARVFAYKGYLVLELLVTKSDDEVTSTIDHPGTFGQVIANTKANLGVSQEAIDLMATVKRGRDSIGDIDWFKLAAGGHAFGWIGGPKAIKQASEIETSRQWNTGEFINIDNALIPPEAKAHIDKM